MDLTGPLWRRRVEEMGLYGVVIADKHGNRSGLAHGGFYATLLDTALGLTARETHQRGHATVSLDLQFLAPAKVGEFLVAESRIVKAARTMFFMQGLLRVDDRICAIGQGTWKIFDPAAPPPGASPAPPLRE